MSRACRHHMSREPSICSSRTCRQNVHQPLGSYCTHDLSHVEHDRTPFCPTGARLNSNCLLHLHMPPVLWIKYPSLPSLARHHTLAISTTLIWSHNASSSAASVGIKEAPTSDVIGTEEESIPSASECLFPHIYGPINPEAVTDELVVNRTEEGNFLSIEGLS